MNNYLNVKSWSTYDVMEWQISYCCVFTEQKLSTFRQFLTGHLFIGDHLDFFDKGIPEPVNWSQLDSVEPYMLHVCV